MSKNRLTLIRNKTMTIPRLELHEAVLASRLKIIIVEGLEVNIDSVHFWSDSLSFKLNPKRKCKLLSVQNATCY